MHQTADTGFLARRGLATFVVADLDLGSAVFLRVASDFVGDSDAMVDEPSTNSVLDLIDSPAECLSVHDQRAEPSMLFGWHVHWFEFIHRRHASQFECVVSVGLAFDIGPFPSVIVGRPDELLEILRLS